MTDKDWPATLGERIKQRRMRKRIPAAELAGRADISVTYMSELENDHRNPSVGILKGIAAALDCSLDWLVFGEEPAGEQQENGG